MSKNAAAPRILTSDSKLLLLFERHLDNILSVEATKSQRAENKAMRLLGLCGLGATALAGIAGYLGALPKPSSSPVQLLNYWLIVAGVLLDARAALLVLRLIKPGKGYQLDEKFVYEFYIDEQTALKRLVEEKAWLYPHSVDFALNKLFLLHRAVRNVVALVTLIIGIGTLCMFEGSISPLLCRSHPLLPHFIGLLVNLVAFRLDWLADQHDALWQRTTEEGE